MELKPYQQQVINDLALFLKHIQETKDVKDAFYNFWAKHPKTPLFPFAGTAIEAYKNSTLQVNSGDYEKYSRKVLAGEIAQVLNKITTA